MESGTRLCSFVTSSTVWWHLCFREGMNFCLSFFSFLCVCARACVCTCTCRSQRLTSGVLLYCSPLYFGGEVLSLNLELVGWLTSMPATPRDLPVCTSPVLGLQKCIVGPGFYLGFGNLNSVPSACIASTLSTEPSIQICFFRSKVWIEPTT